MNSATEITSYDITRILFLIPLRIALKAKSKLRTEVSAPPKFRPTTTGPSSAFIRN